MNLITSKLGLWIIICHCFILPSHSGCKSNDVRNETEDVIQINILSSDGERENDSLVESEFDRLIASNGRVLAPTMKLLEFDPLITQNFYVVNLDENQRMDLVARRSGDGRDPVFLNTQSVFEGSASARESSHRAMDALSSLVQNRRVRVLDLRDVHIPHRYHELFSEWLTVDRLEIGERTFETSYLDTLRLKGVRCLMLDSVVIDLRQMRFLSNVEGLEKVVFKGCSVDGFPIMPTRHVQDEQAPLGTSAQAIFEDYSSISLKNVLEVVLHDSDPRLLIILSDMVLPKLRVLRAFLNDRLYGGGVEVHLEALISAIEKDRGSWPSAELFEFSYNKKIIQTIERRLPGGSTMSSYLSDYLQRRAELCGFELRKIRIATEGRLPER